jgi:hypothetical protein
MSTLDGGSERVRLGTEPLLVLTITAMLLTPLEVGENLSNKSLDERGAEL